MGRSICRQIAVTRAEIIDRELRRKRELDRLVHPLGKKPPRPMTKEEFREAVMRDLGMVP